MIFPVTMGRGGNTSTPREQIQDGELTQSIGGYYPPAFGARGIQKILGRSQVATVVSGVPIDGLVLAEFDNTQDKLVAYAQSGYYARVADPTVAGGFELIASGAIVGGNFQPLQPSGEMFGAHYNDKWFLVNGQNVNIVYEADGTTRRHGMAPPQNILAEDFTKSQPASGLPSFSPGDYDETTVIQSGQSINWVGLTYSNDGDPGTWASITPDVSGWNRTRWFNFAGFETESGVSIEVDWELIRQNPDYGDGGFWDFIEGIAIFRSSVPTFQWRYSTDDGDTWTELPETDWFSQARTKKQISIVPGGVINTSGLRVDLTIRQEGLAREVVYQAHIYEIKMILKDLGQGDPNVAPFTTTSGGMFYAITEYDSQRRLESPAWRLPGDAGITTNADLLENSVVITLPSGSVNEYTTDYRIYRTFDGGTAPGDLYRVGDVPVQRDAEPVFVDTFAIDKDSVGINTYRTLRVVESDGGTTYYDLDTPPRAWKHITHYQGSLVGIDKDNPRSLWYTPPGLPESCPDPIHRIRSFPLAENDRLVGAMEVGEVLVVLAEEAVMSIRGLPIVQGDGVYNIPTIRKLSGQPGCVGVRAFTPLSRDGTDAGAWVSRYGIHITNGDTAQRISDQMWNDVEPSYLDTAVLIWDEKLHTLMFCYDTDGDGENDRWAIFHMREFKQSGFPRITWGHYGNINCLVEGVVNGTQRIMSGHTNDGNVYLEWDGNVDESLAASGVYPGAPANVVPFDIKTGRFYRDEEYEDYEVFKANLRHSNWGAETATVQVFFGRDHNITTSGSISKTVSLNGYGGTEFLIGRSMEWAEFQIQHLGVSGTGSINDLRNVYDGAGDSGNR